MNPTSTTCRRRSAMARHHMPRCQTPAEVVTESRHFFTLVATFSASMSRSSRTLVSDTGFSGLPVDPLHVGVSRSDEVAEGIAAELLARGAGELPRAGRLRHDGERLHCGDVASLDECARRLARLDVDGRQGLHQCRQRLHRRAHDYLLAVRHPALETAGTVRLPVDAVLLVAVDLVVGLRAAQA